jgi:PAS domain S-box-containing protein
VIAADATNSSKFFPGNSEMARRMREFDWSVTPLGPIESWPQSLLASIRLMLNSRYPMFVWWGPELINFYNDAYIPVLGARHPAALGQPASRVWVEIWEVVGPQAEIVMRDGQATWNESILLVMERHGYTEETYFTFSYSPVTDEHGNVGGVFCACTEDTKRILGERRVRTLRALAERATQGKTAEDACAIAATVMRDNVYDLPFAFLYLRDDDGAKACLAGSTITGTSANPAVIELACEANGAWPLGEAAESGESQIINDLDTRFGPGVKLPGGAWPEAARQALVLPIAQPGQKRPSGFLIAGVSPRLLLDDDYRTFLELTAGHVATAIANARAHEEERKRNEALAEIDRAKTVFFSNVSHEFRTPLTLILGPAEEMLSGAMGETTELQRAHLATLRANAVRLQKLVNTLLDFARVEAGRVEANYEPVDLALVTRELASTFCSAVHRAGVLFIVNCPVLDEPVYADRDMWEKIVLNLLSNALKFTLKGSIEVSVRSDDSTFAFVLRDTGVGIPEAELPHLFERFHRVQAAAARTQEGSGIGLALVQELVKLHGGRIEVESELGKGTTFTVFIPKGSAHLPKDRLGVPRHRSSTALGAAPFIEEALRWLPDESDGKTAARLIAGSQVISMPVSSSPATEHIIIADDNLDMRNYLRRLLELHWNVETVENGARALAAAREQPAPDLIIADVMMPGLNGFELLQQLRADVRTKTIPMILLSARAGEEAYIEGMNAGADDYIVKPFGARELIARIKALLEVTRVRRESEKALRQSEERFRKIADSSPIMIWMTDAHGKALFLNRTYRECFAVSAEDAVSFNWADIIHPDDRERYIDAFKAALQKQETFHQRVRLRRHDGQWRWFESRGNPILDDAGNMTAFIGSSPDITEIYESQQRLKELDQRKDEFLANMSHEIRSPLTGIMGYADILLAKLKDPEDIEYLNTIKESGDYLIEIVNDILDLSKIEAGKLVLNIEPVSLHSILAEVQGLMNGRARQKDLPLSLRYESALPEAIQTDRTRLRQILINLVSNAVKFTEHGRVEIVAKSAEGVLQVEVIDTGIGIAPEHQEILFQPFTQADTTSTRVYGGTGLGLTITRRLVEMLGGSISFESELDKGSTFCVRIPTGLAQNDIQTPEVAARSPSIEKDLVLRNRHVLVVDDREEICYLVSRYIKDAGGRPEAALDGEAAIRAVEAAARIDPFHAIILDIQMPGMDGYEVTRRLRAKGFRTPILALTAGAMVGDREKCLRVGCDDYLTKPIDRTALVQRVAYHAERLARAKLRILLVDDSHNACQFLTGFLEKRGHEVRFAYDGQSALCLAQEFRPDAIVLDIRLPDMNGYELMQRLKKMDGLSRATFIGVSGYFAAASSTEFDHFFEKPLDTARLDDLLRSMFDIEIVSPRTPENIAGAV